MKFVDEAKIYLQAGDGGDGCMSFRRESYVPRGGPNGGNGGNGGSIIFEGRKELSTLMDFRYNRHFRGKRGDHGRGSSQHGKGADDIVLPVPLGTQIYDNDTGDLLADITEEGQRFVAAKGGKGGRGNENFKSSIKQAPSFAQPGEEGEERNVRLELKVMADVGLIGFPNAGKSTFLSTISNARPEVAGYPFTTKTPCLGVVPLQDYKSFVVADLPGLIEGAHEGKGMGDVFLKHCERTRVYLHLVSLAPDEIEDPMERFAKIENELVSYDPQFRTKKHLILLTKIELISDEEVAEWVQKFEKEGQKAFPISSVARLNIDSVILEVAKLLNDQEPV